MLLMYRLWLCTPTGGKLQGLAWCVLSIYSPPTASYFSNDCENSVVYV